MRGAPPRGPVALAIILAVLCAAAAALLSGAAGAQQDRRSWPERITIGTASPGGTYHIYGAGWARLVQQELGIAASAVVTGGPVQNATMVQNGALDLAMVTLGPAHEAWTGESPLAPGLRHDQLRAIFPMYQTPFEIIALSGSGITSVTDLQGRTVGVGPAGGTADAYFPRFLELLGIRFIRRNGGASAMSRQLRDGQLDAFAFAAGNPIAAFVEAETAWPVTIFTFTEPQIQRLLAQFPTLSRFTVPAGTYRSATVSQDTVAMWNFAIARADLPESLVHAIVKTVMEQHGRMLEIHPSAAETLPENVLRNTVLPLHPGAVRYFREIGIALPPDMIPADSAG